MKVRAGEDIRVGLVVGVTLDQESGEYIARVFTDEQDYPWFTAIQDIAKDEVIDLDVTGSKTVMVKPDQD